VSGCANNPDFVGRSDLGRFLEDIIIVDPSGATQQKHIGLFSRVASTARVISFRSFAQLASLLG
jgi:hypothetical protein